MIRFRVLGAVSLRSTEDRSVEAILTQPKSLAFLTFLAGGQPIGRFVRREQLLSTFWPEVDEEHGRHALRQVLYKLRRELGEDVVTSRGEGEVGLDGGKFWCDVGAFHRMCRAGKVRRALELYRGELLAGFFVPGAPEFEHWLMRERERLGEAAADCAWKLAEETEQSGDAVEAARWARRAIRLLPYDEAALRRSIILLDRVGDRAGALHAYDEFARELHREFGADPAPSTQALVRGFRGGR